MKYRWPNNDNKQLGCECWAVAFFFLLCKLVFLRMFLWYIYAFESLGDTLPWNVCRPSAFNKVINFQVKFEADFNTILPTEAKKREFTQMILNEFAHMWPDVMLSSGNVYEGTSHQSLGINIDALSLLCYV